MLNSRLNENPDILLGEFGSSTAMSDTAKKQALRAYERQVGRGTAPTDANGGPPKKGGILAALRRSPLVGADLDLTRSRDIGREVDL